jgi:hypothetical protein
VALQTIAVRQGDKFGIEYSLALKHQVPGITVLGDDRPFRTELKGWHAKLELFAPWNADLRPAIYFDLDTFVLGDLSPFERLDKTQLWLIDNFNSPRSGESGLMLIPDNDELCAKIFTTNITGPDGPYIQSFPHRRLNREIDGIYSYKRHCRERKPDDARIICFHGFPKQTDLKNGWAYLHWTTIISQMKKS